MIRRTLGTRLSDAQYRATRPLRTARGNYRNWSNARTRARGRRSAFRIAGDNVKSRMPVVRDRINPGTGRKHADDAEIGRRFDQAMGRRRLAAQARYDAARRSLADNARAEKAQGIRDETPEFLNRNAEVIAAERDVPWHRRGPLPPSHTRRSR